MSVYARSTVPGTYGLFSGTTDANGIVTVPFGRTFQTAPTVQVTRISSSTTAVAGGMIVSGSVTTTQFQYRCFSNNTRQNSTAVSLYWKAD